MIIMRSRTHEKLLPSSVSVTWLSRSSINDCQSCSSCSATIIQSRRSMSHFSLELECASQRRSVWPMSSMDTAILHTAEPDISAAITSSSVSSTIKVSCTIDAANFFPRLPSQEMLSPRQRAFARQLRARSATSPSSATRRCESNGFTTCGVWVSDSTTPHSLFGAKAQIPGSVDFNAPSPSLGGAVLA